MFLFTAASSRQLSLPGTWVQKSGSGTQQASGAREDMHVPDCRMLQ